MAKFDPVLKQHVADVETRVIHTPYLHWLHWWIDCGANGQRNLIKQMQMPLATLVTCRRCSHCFLPMVHLKKNMTTNLKSWSDTRWESPINRVDVATSTKSDQHSACQQIIAVRPYKENWSLPCKLQRQWICLWPSLCQRAVWQDECRSCSSVLRHFSYEVLDQEMTDALKKMEISFFSVVVVQERFQTLGEVEKKFGVLVNFPAQWRAKKTMWNTQQHPKL